MRRTNTRRIPRYVELSLATDRGRDRMHPSIKSATAPTTKATGMRSATGIGSGWMGSIGGPGGTGGAGGGSAGGGTYPHSGEFSWIVIHRLLWHMSFVVPSHRTLPGMPWGSEQS